MEIRNGCTHHATIVIHFARNAMLKHLDWYIIKKYLGTFALSIVLIITISVIFDFTEKIDNFLENNAPAKAIVFDYYMNFIPFFANMFTPLFAFISVIFFTSKLANNSEIIAMLAGGMSFRRLMVPYLISAGIITICSFLLMSFVIPPANKIRLAFEDQYVSKFKSEVARNVQLEIEPGVIAYFERYEEGRAIGRHFSLEKFEGKQLVSRLTAQEIVMDSLYHWKVKNYLIRDFDGLYEYIQKGSELDTVIYMDPADFFITAQEAAQMSTPKLRQYIAKQKARGLGNTQAFLDEYYTRYSTPLAAIILTLIGVSLSSRKVRGGMGINIGIGLALSALYILFTTFSSQLAIAGSVNPLLAAWTPNLLFLAVGLYLYAKAPK